MHLDNLHSSETAYSPFIPVQSNCNLSFCVECQVRVMKLGKEICLESRQGFSLPVLAILLTVFLEQ